MKIHSVTSESLSKAYGILCDRVYPHPQTPGLPFGSTWCVVEPSGTTTPHDHHEGESFFILKGKGLMSIGAESTEVKPGDVIYIPPFSKHQLKNLSEIHNLEFISMWWPFNTQVEDRLPEFALITSAPPTPNGDLHLGHLSGPYIASDVYARYLKMRNIETLTVSGSDDNQSYVPAKANQMGVAPSEVVSKFAESNEATLKKIGNTLDYFLRPQRNQEYIAFVQDFFKKLVHQGKVVLKNMPSLHCDHCHIYLYEAHVQGLCPTCRSTTNGNGCESCGMTNDCVDLIDPTCKQCKNTPRVELTKRFYFPLNDYSEALRSYYSSVQLNSHMRAMTEELLHSGLPEVSVSHLSNWGIEAPGLKGQVIYEWFEMAAGYVYMAQKLSSYENVFSNASKSQIVQFFGFDNSFFYAAFIPAVLLAYDPDIKLPGALISNEFYRLEGEKFSTSRKHAIWADDILEFVPADVLRFYLCHDRPEMEQTNFCLNEFKSKIESELVSRLEVWLQRLDETLKIHFDGKAPKFELTSREQSLFHQQLIELTHDSARNYSVSHFSLRAVTRNLCRLLSLTSSFGRSQAFLKHIPDLKKEWHGSVALELTALKTFALVALPIMPQFSKSLLKALGQAAQWDELVTPLTEGRTILKLKTDFFSKSLRQIEKFERERS